MLREQPSQHGMSSDHADTSLSVPRTPTPLRCAFHATLLPFLLAAATILPTPALASANGRATWTIMVFMDADNNLEGSALTNFLQIAMVGSTRNVNILVELDRIPDRATTEPDWSGTLIFRVEGGMLPVPDNAAADLGEVNMGDPASLTHFIRWSATHYPADRYALVIWDHGAGWRLLNTAARSQRDSCGAAESTPGSLRSTQISPVRSASFDSTNADLLYNSEIAQAIVGANLKAPIDVLGFDACLMAMAESVYEFRNVARLLVASEELVPGPGWDYFTWLTRVVKNPKISPRECAKAILDSYQGFYSQTAEHPVSWTTLSVIDLGEARSLVASISSLSKACTDALEPERDVFHRVRAACGTYAPPEINDGAPFYHIDLHRWCELLALQTRVPLVRERARDLATKIERAVLYNYVGRCRGGIYGSRGLAIYFPETAEAFATDPRADDGYSKSNNTFPVAFVRDSEWPYFLNAYLGNR